MAKPNPRSYVVPRALTCVVLVFCTACGGSSARPTSIQSLAAPRSAFAAAERKAICLVLSVGAADALVHLGSIRAVQRSGLKIDCVVGNSMGALIGGLYATAPSEDPVVGYRAFMQKYVENGTEEATGRGFLGFLFGAALTVFSGGAAAPALLAGAATGVAGMGSTDERSLERTVATLNETFNGAMIETLPIRYATSYHDLGTKITLIKVTRGNLAEAIGKSVANPMVFTHFDPIKAHYLDPGADRVSAVPVQDACELFPEMRLLVINATDQPAFYQRSIPCPVLEVRVHAGQVDPQALRGEGVDFDRAIGAGATAAQVALQRAGVPTAEPFVGADRRLASSSTGNP